MTNAFLPDSLRLFTMALPYCPRCCSPCAGPCLPQLTLVPRRYGKVTSCDIIRDFKTGDSLCYAFIGFDTDEACEAAYFKMNNVLIDDRRIRVDFSQSVHNIWKQFRAHGAKGGNAQVAKDAAQHERGAGGGLELKQQYQQYGGRGGGKQGLLFDQPERQPAAPQRQYEAPRQGLGSSSRAREERAYPPPQQQQQPERQRRRSRSRSRSRDRSKKRHRSSSRERKHDKKHSHKSDRYDYAGQERSRGDREDRQPVNGDSSRRDAGDKYNSSQGHHSSRHDRDGKHRSRDRWEQEQEQRQREGHRSRGEDHDRGRSSRGYEEGRDERHRGSSRRSDERSRERPRHRSRSRDREQRGREYR